MTIDNFTADQTAAITHPTNVAEVAEQDVATYEANLTAGQQRQTTAFDTLLATLRAIGKDGGLVEITSLDVVRDSNDVIIELIVNE